MTNPPKIKLLLDSGAFSAWTKNEFIDLDAYIDYIKAHKHLLWQYVNLDVIPGRLNQKRTPQEVEDSARQSHENQQTMKHAGLKPVPVFHQGEDFKWLEIMVKEGETYIGISPADDTADASQREWLDRCFTCLTDKDGWPLVKTHGFGVTAPPFLLRYPWFTCDSTTWVMAPGYGRIFAPGYRNGKPYYLGRPTVVKMTDSQGESNSKYLYFEALGEAGEAQVRRWIEEEVKSSLVEMRYDTNTRRKAMLTYYQGLQNSLPPVRFKHKVSLGFGMTLPSFPDMKPIKNMKLQIIAATSTDHTRSRVLNEFGVSYRLLSYYQLREQESHLEKYVKYGIINPNYKPQVPAQNWLSAHINYRALELYKHLRAYDDYENGTDEAAGESAESCSRTVVDRSDTGAEPLLVFGRQIDGVQRSDRNLSPAQNRVQRRSPRRAATQSP